MADKNLMLRELFQEYKKENPFVLFLILLVTLGAYGINWIYLKNKKFYDVCEDSPDPKRGLVLMFFFPFSWIIIFYEARIIFGGLTQFFKIIELIGWFIIMFLILQYVYDFCENFADLTNSIAFFWYIGIYLGFLGLILSVIGFYYLLPMLLFPITTIPVMQAKLNQIYYKFRAKEEKSSFEIKARKASN